MPYENIPGVGATFLDGAFKIPTASSQPKILVVGPAKSGKTNEFFNVAEVSGAEREFGAQTEVMRAVHESVAQGADNIAIMRSGGKQGSWVFADSASATLTIVPAYRDDTILERYALFIENDGTNNRYMVYDVVDQEWVYDSSDVLVIEDGIVTVEDSGIALFTLFDKTDIPAAKSLNAVVTGDFVAAGAVTAASVTATAGTDGTSVSLVERYAALNSTYHLLDYRDADMVIPTDVYIDAANVSTDTTAVAAGGGATDAEKYGYFWKGVPGPGSAEDALGFIWEYRYRGAVYTYVTDVEDYFAGLGTAAAATVIVNSNLDITASKVGKGGNAITIEIIDDSAEGIAVTETDFGLAIVCTLDISGGSPLYANNSDLAPAINIELSNTILRSGVAASTLVSASGGATAVATVVPTNLAGGLGGAVLTPSDLTGDSIPSGVSTRWAAGTDAELRECSFAHQLASFCNVASEVWSTMLGVISFKAPPEGFSRAKIASWLGVAPTVTDDGVDLYIDSPADNGSGVLGHKLMAGESKTSAGYRSALIEGGNTTDGYYLGGLIRTVGASLPNGSEWPYGINDADEALDSGGKPVDIGKHVFVTYDWPILSNGYNGGSRYRGALPATFAAKVALTPSNLEPIGDNGALTAIQSPVRAHSTQVNDLAGQRLIGVRRNDSGTNFILTTARTAAHPDSDYARLSTIRSANLMITGIRQLAAPYIGTDFSAQRLASLQAAIDLFIITEQGNGMHQGARAAIQYTRADKIAGRLRIKLRMVPPFSIEAITIETSMAADESEL